MLGARPQGNIAVIFGNAISVGIEIIDKKACVFETGAN